MNKKLDVPFYAQNDNERWIDGAHGNTQCNITAHAMLCSYLIPDFASRSKANGFKEPESYLRSKFYNYSTSRGDHDAMTRCLDKDFGLKTEWRYDGDTKDIERLILNDKPVAVGVDYKMAGHILLVVGFYSGGLLVHDSYGIRAGSSDYYSQINNGNSDVGAFDRYSWETFNAIWYPGKGWYRDIKE